MKERGGRNGKEHEEHACQGALRSRLGVVVHAQHLSENPRFLPTFASPSVDQVG